MKRFDVGEIALDVGDFTQTWSGFRREYGDQ